MTASDLLSVSGLTVEFSTRRGVVKAVTHLNLSLAPGEILGVVGESGSGKSVTSYAVMRILDRAGRIAAGRIVYSGVDIVGATDGEMCQMRGREMSMIFQNPRAALNPIRKVGRQIADVLLEHGRATPGDAKARAIDMLTQVRIARPAERYHAYPFELSGGMCQRVVIAMALACEPRLLIADEPTTGLDVTTQKAVLDLVGELTRKRRMSTILITHDLGLAAAYCDRIAVMQSGRVVETAGSAALFREPAHAYTRMLVRATPRSGATIRDLLPQAPSSSAAPVTKSTAESGAPLLVVDQLVKEYPLHGLGGRLTRFLRRGGVHPEEKPFRAVDRISFTVGRGETVGLVGESGCGKSTASMMITRLLDLSGGRILFDGEDIGTVPARHFAHLPMRRRLQMVFQDPTESLNPRFTAARAIADPLLRMARPPSRDELRARCEELARLVGLPIELLDRFPHQLSGGQKARVGIARAIATSPELVVLDEPTASLDVSVQALVLNLLQELKERLGISYLFVSHDLNVVRMLCDRAIVMRDGRIVEQGPTAALLDRPSDPYTRQLVEAILHLPS